MFAKLAICLPLIATPVLAQEVAAPDTLALNDEDAQTCKTKGCRTITDAAYALIAQRLQRAEEVEVIAQRLVRELAMSPEYYVGPIKRVAADPDTTLLDSLGAHLFACEQGKEILRTKGWASPGADRSGRTSSF